MRREFLGALGGAAAAWPVAAHAQQSAIPIIGYLNIGGQPGSGGQPNATSLAGFRAGFNELGYVEGRNVAIEIRATEKYEQLADLASDLVRLRPAVIVAAPTVNSAKAAMAATSTIPIVFAMGSDPVKQGLVVSLGRPGGNATGVSFFTTTLAAKRLELLRELVPQVASIGILANPSLLEGQDNVAEIQAAARSIGQDILVLNAGYGAFDPLNRDRPGKYAKSDRKRAAFKLAVCNLIPNAYCVAGAGGRCSIVTGYPSCTPGAGGDSRSARRES